MPTIKKPEIKMPEIKMPNVKMPEINTDVTKAVKDIAAVAKDATYVVIGAGVLGFQQAQVQRQELMKRLAEPKAGIEDRVTAARSWQTKGIPEGSHFQNAGQAMLEMVRSILIGPVEVKLPLLVRMNSASPPR